MQVRKYFKKHLPLVLREKIFFLDISVCHYSKNNKPLVIYRLNDEKEEIKVIEYDELEGELDLSDFKNLEELIIGNHNFTKLKVNNCSKLIKISCPPNLFTDLSQIYQLEEISAGSYIHLPENWSLNLSFFSFFTNLKKLDLGETNSIIDKIVGSLESLENLKQLEFLCIGGHPQITEGLEYLPYKKLTYFGCHNTVFKKQLKPFDYDIKAWKLINVLVKGVEKEDNDLVFNKEKELYSELLRNMIIKDEKALQNSKNELAASKWGSTKSKNIKKISRLETKIELLKFHEESLLSSKEINIVVK